MCFQVFILLALLSTCKSSAIDEEEFRRDFKGYEDKLAFQFFSPLLEGSIYHQFAVRMTVSKGDEECFYEVCEVDSLLLCGFQSDSPSTFRSKGLVSATLRYPNGSIAEETGEPIKQGSVQILCPVDGSYQFCVHNTHDRHASKTVDFQISVAHPHKQVDFHIEKHENNQETDADGYLYVYYDRLYQVCIDLMTSHKAVRIDTAEILRDWELAKENNSMITTVSFLSMFLICSVGFGQIYMIKKLFVTPSTGNGRITAART